MDNIQTVPVDNTDLCEESHKDYILLINDVYEEVRQTEMHFHKVGGYTVLKETSDSVVPKARQVAGGFEEMHIQELLKDCPTCASESLRMIMAFRCQKKWQLNSTDINDIPNKICKL